MSDNLTVKDGANSLDVSLTDIATVDMDAVQEVRSDSMPAGVFEFICKDAKLDVVEQNADRNNPNAGKINVPVVKFEFECENVIDIVAKKDYPDASVLIGKKHFENFRISDIKQDMGRIKAFMNDAYGFDSKKGQSVKGPLQEILDAFKGHRIKAVVIHRVNQNNTDQVFVNLSRDPKKLGPVNKAAAA